jgi:hypothetical protein
MAGGECRSKDRFRGGVVYLYLMSKTVTNKMSKQREKWKRIAQWIRAMEECECDATSKEEAARLNEQKYQQLEEWYVLRRKPTKKSAFGEAIEIAKNKRKATAK